jgi:hypothetical protein
MPYLNDEAFVDQTDLNNPISQFDPLDPATINPDTGKPFTVDDVTGIPFRYDTVEFSTYAQIQGIYNALFNRPADPNGIGYFGLLTNGGKDLTAIGDLTNTAEYLDRFTGLSREEIIQSLYQSLFGRTGDAAGVKFFADELEAGRQSINSIAINILDGAQGADKDLVDKKIDAANKFTSAIDTQAERDDYNGATNPSSLTKAADFLSKVTATSPTVTQADADAAVADLGGTPLPATGDDVGVTINLHTASDTVLFNPQKDKDRDESLVYESTADNDTINAKDGTFTDTTSIDGGPGTDSIFAISSNNTSTINPTLSNTENVYVTQTVAGGTFDFRHSTGVSELWVKGGSGVTFNNITLGTKLGIEDNNAGAVFDFRDSDVGGGYDAITLAVKNSNVGVTVDNRIEKIEIESVSRSSISLIGNYTEITVIGKGELQLSTSSSIRTLDASFLDGVLKNSAILSDRGVEFIGTKQADAISFTSNNNTKDTIVFKPVNTSTMSSRDIYANFDSSSEDKIDVSAYGITTVQRIKTAGFTGADSEFMGGNAVAVVGANTVYVDINSDGRFNAATDLVFDITGATANLDASDFIF